MQIIVNVEISDVVLSTTGGNSTFTLNDQSDYSITPRNTVAVYTTVSKSDFQGNLTPITLSSINTPDPVTNTIWTYIYTTDGWYQSPYVAIPIYSAGTYSIYDAVYVASNKTVWYSSIPSNSNALTGSGGTGWVQVVNPTSLAYNFGLTNQSNNIVSSILNFVLYPVIKKNFGIQTGIAFLEQSTDSKRTKDVLKYHLYGLAVDAINQASLASNYALAEIISRRASLLN